MVLRRYRYFRIDSPYTYNLYMLLNDTGEKYCIKFYAFVYTDDLYDDRCKISRKST